MNDYSNLVFLISQPRAGSTLLQRILGCNPDVYTTSEPWLMLHPIYSLKRTGIDAEYSSDLALNGLCNFLSLTVDGRDRYLDDLRHMYGNLYQRVLESTGKSVFLDKTPRYYFIITELYGLFPKAKFILLFRNPLAVFSSIMQTWIKKNRDLFWLFRQDLLQAPDYLIKGVQALGPVALSVQYENILLKPEEEIKRLCDYAGIRFNQEMIEYGRFDLPKWPSGDQDTVYQKRQPDPVHSEKWILHLQDADIWRFSKEYLDYLGAEKTAQLGYSFDDLATVLENYRPQNSDNSMEDRLLDLMEGPVGLFEGSVQLLQHLQQTDRPSEINTETMAVLTSYLEKIKELSQKERQERAVAVQKAMDAASVAERLLMNERAQVEELRAKVKSLNAKLIPLKGFAARLNWLFRIYLKFRGES